MFISAAEYHWIILRLHQNFCGQFSGLALSFHLQQADNSGVVFVVHGFFRTILTPIFIFQVIIAMTI